MAGSDYCSCDNCGKGKVFYDANVDWESFGERIGQIRVICAECFESGVRLKIVDDESTLEFDPINNYGIHSWTKEMKR